MIRLLKKLSSTLACLGALQYHFELEKVNIVFLIFILCIFLLQM
jgi:hypothetical protein